MTQTILAGHRVMFAEGQLSDHVEGLLAELVEELGGVMVEVIRQASIVLSNPSSPLYGEAARLHEFCKITYQPGLILAPYHYLYAVRNAGKLFPIDELQPPAPIFIHPETHEPLRIYVSINIDHSAYSIEAGLTSVQNKADLQRQLEACGAIMEETRRGCDVGLFCLAPTMAQSLKFAREIRAMGKLVAGRDWAESCISTGTLRWKAIVPVEDAKSDAEDKGCDSMAEDGPLTPAKASRGPGRPAGSVRREYSAEEDDLLCRWLAAHKPGGSHLSRKTYEIMCAMEKAYPWVASHSFQSWHQRFKNNSAAFGTRVNEYIRRDIDKDLKTAKERAKERESRPANKRARADDESQGGQSMAKKSRLDAAADVQWMISHDPDLSSSSPAPAAASDNRPVNAPRLRSRSPSLRSQPFEKQEAPSQAVAGPGPSSFAAAQSANRHMLVTLSESSDDEPGRNVHDNSVVDTRGDPTKSPARASHATHTDTPADPELVQPANAQTDGVESIPPVLDEDDAAIDAALFPGDPLPLDSLLDPEYQQRTTASPARAPSPPAEPQPETLMGAETQAMLQQHQEIKRLGGHMRSPAGEEHAQMTVAVHQGSPTGRVRLSMSVDGDAVVNIDIAGNREQTPHVTEAYVRHPGSARKLLRGGKGASIEEIHTSGGSRRRSSIKARPSLSAIRHTPDVVLRHTASTHTSPLATVSRLAAPAQLRPSTGTVQEGSAALAANKAKYRAWLLRMQEEYGKTPKEVVAIQDRLKLAASKAAGGGVVTLGPSAIEAELKKLAQAG